MKATAPRTKATDHAPADYDGLVARFGVPRPIRDEADLENATEAIDALAGFELTDDQADYLDLLSDLVEKYEREHRPFKVRKLTPAEVVHSLMTEHRMTAARLGELLGDRSLASKVLSGQRELSKQHIRTLAEHFRISADLLI